jgi:hypothetical protein
VPGPGLIVASNTEVPEEVAFVPVDITVHLWAIDLDCDGLDPGFRAVAVFKITKNGVVVRTQTLECVLSEIPLGSIGGVGTNDWHIEVTILDAAGRTVASRSVDGKGVPAEGEIAVSGGGGTATAGITLVHGGPR